MNVKVAEKISLITNILRTIESVLLMTFFGVLLSLCYAIITRDELKQLWIGGIFLVLGVFGVVVMSIGLGVSIVLFIMAMVSISLRKKHMRGRASVTGRNYLKSDSIIKIVISLIEGIGILWLSFGEGINGELIFLIAWNVVILVLSVIEFKSA